MKKSITSIFIGLLGKLKMKRTSASNLIANNLPYISASTRRSDKKNTAIFVLLFVLCISMSPTTAVAHCNWHHPHHCIQNIGKKIVDFGKTIYGGTAKRAKMIWHDPLGSAVNPLKIIDKSIPTPSSYVEYLIKNPDEIVETLKNPVAGVVGMPVAMAISDGRNAALKKGVQRIPEEIKAQLSMYYDKALLDSVRYTVGKNFFDGLTQAISLHTTADAITLINVIVFKNDELSRSPDIWAHEMFHVRQYKELGLTKFAATWTLDSYRGNASAIEKPAYAFDELFSQIRRTKHISSRLLVGLGGKCMSVDSMTQYSPVVLSTCRPTAPRQQWILNDNSEIRLANTDLCLDVQWGNPENRTPLHLWSCNGTDAQSFYLSSNGEIKNALRNNLCVEAAGGRTTNGTPIQVFDCNHTSSQVWQKPSVNLISSLDNLCMQAVSGSDGSLVQLSTCQQNNPLQMWSMEKNKGEIRLINFPNKCLDVRWSGTEDGTPLHIWPCNGGIGAQSFHLTKNMQFVAMGKCVDVRNNSVQINSCRDNIPTQIWNTNFSIPNTLFDRGTIIFRENLNPSIGW